MFLALTAAAVVLGALLGEMLAPVLLARWRRHRNGRRVAPAFPFTDEEAKPAEQRARELLRSCVGEEQWAMYRDLGFIRVWGRAGTAYLIYPHRPIVAYLPATGRPLQELVLELGGPAVQEGLADSDDVLAKWMALSGDQAALLDRAVATPPGHCVDPRRVRADIWRLSRWERTRMPA